MAKSTTSEYIAGLFKSDPLVAPTADDILQNKELLSVFDQIREHGPDAPLELLVAPVAVFYLQAEGISPPTAPLEGFIDSLVEALVHRGSIPPGVTLDMTEVRAHTDRLYIAMAGAEITLRRKTGNML